MTSAEKLKRILTAEIEAQKTYAELLETEADVLRKFDPQKVEELTAQREIVAERMRGLRDERMLLVKELTGDERTNLEKVISNKFSGRDKRELDNLRKRFKAIALKARKKGFEATGVVNFALNLVNGTMSLIYSATQNIVKSYSRHGAVKESTSPPAGLRHSGISKEA